MVVYMQYAHCCETTIVSVHKDIRKQCHASVSIQVDMSAFYTLVVAVVC